MSQTFAERLQEAASIAEQPTEDGIRTTIVVTTDGIQVTSQAGTLTSTRLVALDEVTESAPNPLTIALNATRKDLEGAGTQPKSADEIAAEMRDAASDEVLP